MKVIWIVVGVIMVIALGIGGFLFMQNKPAIQPVEMAPIASEPTPTAAPESQKYSNEAGFSFEHPSDVTVKENELDAVSYADLELTSIEHPGTITIKIVDTKLKDLPAWKKTAKTPTTAESTQVQLGDLGALRIQDGEKLQLVSVGQSVIYTIEAAEADDYWTKVFDNIADTWKFELPVSPTTAPAKSSGGGAPAAGGDIFEEETIE